MKTYRLRSPGLARSLLLPALFASGVTISVRAGIYTWNTTAGSWSVNTNWTGSPSAGGPDAAGDFVTISPSGTNTVTLFNSDGGDAVKTIGSLTFSGGTTTLSAGSGTGSLDFDNNGSNSILKQTAGTVTISAAIATHSSSPLDVTNQNGSGTTNRFFLNGLISGNGALSVNGPGGVVLGSASNSFSGGVTLNSGTLTAGGGSGSYLGTGTLTINGGTLSAGGIANSTWTSSNVQAWNGDFSTSGAFTLNTGTGAVTLSGNRAITLSGSTTANLILGGVIADGGSGYGLTLTGSSRMTLSGANTYTGATTIGSGVTLILGSAGTTGSLSASSAITTNGTLAFNRTNTMTQGVDFAAVITGTGGVTQSASGSTVLNGANTFTGATAINAGSLSVASLNSVSGGIASSNLGAPVTVTNGTIAMGATTVSGALAYTGTGEITDRVINLAGTTGGATIDQSGSGLLKFTSAFTATGAGSKALTLQGSTAGTGEISGAIVDNSGTNVTRLTKAGTGTWTLSGANTYTGVTTISGGTLLANNSTGSATGTAAVTVNGGSFGGTGTSSGAITVNAGGAITPGNAGAGTFHGGSSLTWNSDNTLAGMTFDLGVNQAASDQLALAGAFTKGTGSTFVFNFVDAGYTPSIAYTVVTFGSTTFSAGDFSATGVSGIFAIVGSTLQFTTAIPEPSTYAAVFGALALGGALIVRRRRA